MNRSKSLVTSARQGAFRIALLVGLFAVAPDVSLSAQSLMGEMRRQARREELEKAAKFAENASTTAPDEKTREKYRLDAEVIIQRLANGDFIPGDRILILVQGDTALTDTFTVRGDRMLPLPNIPPISLQGVLDSELEEYLTKELLRYIKEVQLEATPQWRTTRRWCVVRVTSSWMRNPPPRPSGSTRPLVTWPCATAMSYTFPTVHRLGSTGRWHFQSWARSPGCTSSSAAAGAASTESSSVHRYPYRIAERPQEPASHSGRGVACTSRRRVASDGAMGDAQVG